MNKNLPKNNAFINVDNNIISEYKENSIISTSYSFKIEYLCYNKHFTIHPYFQRNYVWNTQKQSDLIETVLLGMPIPSIYSYIDFETKEEIIIDGQQRLNTILNFLNNKFCLTDTHHYQNLNNLYFEDLPSIFKYKIQNFKLHCICMSNIKNKDIIFEIFKRYNTGGVSLNHQEIRNCIYSGPYNDLIKELTKYEPFYNIFENNKIDRMEKEEFVLRFLALYQDLNLYNGDMIKFLDNHLKNKLNRNDIKDEKFLSEIKTLKKIFKKTVDSCLIVFGEDTFKNCLNIQTPTGIKSVMYKLISKTVFDLQMLGFADFDYDLIRRHAKEIKLKYEHVINNEPDLKPYYKKMSKKAVTHRVNTWKEYISNIIYS